MSLRSYKFVRGLVFLLLILPMLQANAAIDRKSLPKFILNGAIHGGQARGGVSILKFQFQPMSDENKGLRANSEKLIIDLGTRKDVPLQGIASYFHAQNNSENLIFNLSLSQLMDSKYDEIQLRRIMIRSQLVDELAFTRDPADAGGNITFRFKNPTAVRVYGVASDDDEVASKIVVEMRPYLKARKRVKHR